MKKTAMAAALAAFLTAIVHAQLPLPVSGEFQVNTYTTGDQEYPVVAAAPNGEFVVLWRSRQFGGGDGNDAAGQRFDSSGAKIGDEFLLHEGTTGSQGFYRDIAMADDGSFVAIWSDSEGEGVMTARRFAPDGSPLLAPVAAIPRVEDRSTFTPRVGSDSDGDFVVVWTGQKAGSTRQIYGRMFASDGSPSGDEFMVNETIFLNHEYPEVGMQPSGSFVVTWRGIDADDTGIEARIFASDGSPLTGEFLVNTLTYSFQQSPDIGIQSNGDFMISWSGRGGTTSADYTTGLWGRRFASDGTPFADQFKIDTYGGESFSSITVDPNDNFLVVWEDSRDNESIYARRLDSAGNTWDTPFRISAPEASRDRAPSAAIGGDGEIAFVWFSVNGPGDDTDPTAISARLYQLPEGGIGNFVWLDKDFDGVQDFLEPGIPGVRVNLYDDVGGLITFAETDENGFFAFLREPGNARYLEFEAPPGYVFTAADQGDDNLDSDADPMSGQTIIFTVDPTIANYSWDAGFATGFGDWVWLDENGNGVQDVAEPGVGGVLVRLLNAADDTEIARKITDAAGKYSFSNVVAGNYKLAFGCADGDFVGLTSQDQGGDDALDSDVDPMTGQTAAFAFSPGVVDLNLDAGLLDPGDGLQCFEMFADGFESGDVSLWSGSNP